MTTEQAAGAVSDCHFIAAAGEPHDIDFVQHVVSRMHVSRPRWLAMIAVIWQWLAVIWQ